jgi:hypothetical protein
VTGTGARWVGWPQLAGAAAAVLGVLVACGGSEPEDTGAPDVGGAAWIGEWAAVTEDGAPAEGTLSLTATAFEQTSDFGSGTCTWTGAVSEASDTHLTLATESGTGGPECELAVGASASPTWAVSDGDATLTLDYRDAVPFGTLQVWQRQ